MANLIYGFPTDSLNFQQATELTEMGFVIHENFEHFFSFRVETVDAFYSVDISVYGRGDIKGTIYTSVFSRLSQTYFPSMTTYFDSTAEVVEEAVSLVKRFQLVNNK